MKTMIKGNNIVRAEEHQVPHFLRQGYNFCSKKIWKENVRDHKNEVSSDKNAQKNKRRKKM